MINQANKIFFIGMPKTGLSTIKSALELEGYKVSGSPRRIYGRTENDIRNAFRKKATEKSLADYDAFCDLPWSVEYRWLYEQCPEATFVLTVRSEDDWVESYMAQFSGKTNVFHLMIFGEAVRRGNKKALINEYRRFNQEAIKFFCDHKKFFVLKTPQDLGWEHLGLILAKELGTGRLPKRNPKENRAGVGWWIRRKPRAFAGRLVRNIRGSR